MGEDCSTAAVVPVLWVQKEVRDSPGDLMGSFSIWHWLIVLLIIGLPIYLVRRNPVRKNASQPMNLSSVEMLEKLAKLKADGSITEAEYEAQKKRLLG